MTLPSPDALNLSPADLAALEAQVLGLADPAIIRALDGALAPAAPRADLVQEVALLADPALAALLDEALAVEAPAGLADCVVAAAPLHQALVAGRIVVQPAIAGQTSDKGAWMRKPWRYAAVASISFSLSLMAVSLISSREDSVMNRVLYGQVAADLGRLGQVAGQGDDGLGWELAEAQAEAEFAGL